MFRKWRIKRPSHTTVVSYLALFLALGTGGAYAANTIGSSDVINGSLVSKDIKNATVSNVDIRNNAVTTQKLKKGAVASVDILDATVSLADLAANSVNGDNVAPESLTSADIANDSIDGGKISNDSLTTADIAGADVNGGRIQVSTGLVPNGRCKQLEANIPGAKAGEAVVFSIKAPVQDGIVIYGQRVPSDGNVTLDVCNFSGITQAEIVDLPVRVITFG
jgi:hypothetical protein